jgi:hypothetical protein
VFEMAERAEARKLLLLSSPLVKRGIESNRNQPVDRTRGWWISCETKRSTSSVILHEISAELAASVLEVTRENILLFDVHLLQATAPGVLDGSADR